MNIDHYLRVPAGYSLRVSEGAAERYWRLQTVFQVAALLLLYPGFFFYHTLVAMGYVPPALGGYYGVVAAGLVGLGTLLFLFAFKSGCMRLTRVDFLFLLFAGYLILWAFLHYRFGMWYQRDPALLMQSLSVVVLWLANYYVFRQFDADSKVGIFLVIACVLLMALVVFGNAESGFFYARRLAETDAEEVVATYQGFARSAVVVALVALSVSRGAKLIILYFVFLSLLFLLGARSEFAALLLVGLVPIYLRSGAVRFALAVMPVLAVGLVYFFLNANEFSGTSRIFRLLDYQTDTSFNLRAEQIWFAVRDIQRTPLFGNFGGYMLYGSSGSYAHNAISAWHSFGIVGFCGFAFLIFLSLRVSLKAALVRGDRSGQAMLALMMSLFCLLMAVAAKSIFFPLYAAAWGLAAGLVDRRE